MATPSPSSEDQAYKGALSPSDATSQFNAQSFLVWQILAGLWTVTVVKVVAVTGGAGALAEPGTVDVQPLVNQIDGDGAVTEHGTIYGVPYFRLQGGHNAIIIDPEVGDLGIALFASRDISAVKANKAASPPGSRRQFDPADAIYLGGLLNGVPTQYVQFSATGIALKSPTQISLEAPDIQFKGPTHTTGNVTGDGTAIYQGDVTGNGTSLHTHKHSGVTTGSGQTGTPV